MEHGFEHSPEEAQLQQDEFRVQPRRRASSPRRRCVSDDYVVHIDFGEHLRITSEEIAILRTFLSDEIRTILYNEGQEE